MNVRNNEQKRREFLGMAGVGATWLATARAGWAAAEGTHNPDLVVDNAKVYTVDAGTPRAEAFAVKGGRFTAIGASGEIKALAGKGTEALDARGMTIVPGFIDCHNHAPGIV